jgi:hypothetical protein
MVGGRGRRSRGLPSWRGLGLDEVVEELAVVLLVHHLVPDVLLKVDKWRLSGSSVVLSSAASTK